MADHQMPETFEGGGEVSGWEGFEGGESECGKSESEEEAKDRAEVSEEAEYEHSSMEEEAHTSQSVEGRSGPSHCSPTFQSNSASRSGSTPCPVLDTS
jgi:hypothetical protein